MDLMSGSEETKQERGEVEIVTLSSSCYPWDPGSPPSFLPRKIPNKTTDIPDCDISPNNLFPPRGYNCGDQLVPLSSSWRECFEVVAGSRSSDEATRRRTKSKEPTAQSQAAAS